MQKKVKHKNSQMGMTLMESITNSKEFNMMMRYKVNLDRKGKKYLIILITEEKIRKKTKY